MKSRIVPIAALLLLGPLMASTRESVIHRIDESTTALAEIMSAPDKGIPHDLLEKAHCVVIIPGMKQGAFLFGGKYGKGFISCRANGTWSAPGSVRIEGGSFGIQAGGSETDVILLVMNARGAERLLSSRFTLGGEGAVAAGPVGRSASAETDAKMTAEILAWSRARGIFAGISLQGATLRQDLDDNQALYSRRLENVEIVKSSVAAPRSAAKLQAFLQRYSPRER